jgi:hypothetical protein
MAFWGPKNVTYIAVSPNAISHQQEHQNREYVRQNGEDARVTFPRTSDYATKVCDNETHGSNPSDREWTAHELQENERQR